MGSYIGNYNAPSGQWIYRINHVKINEDSSGNISYQWVGDFNQELYDEWAPALWDTLNGWEENLWRGGETYPATVNELHELFANGEIDFTINPAANLAQLLNIGA